jgi:hypothetical protein
VVTEYKYGSSTLGSTKDGLQMSDDWLRGVNTGRDRLADAVGRETSTLIEDAFKSGTAQKWLVRVDEGGNVTSQVLDGLGKAIKGP